MSATGIKHIAKLAIFFQAISNVDSTLHFSLIATITATTAATAITDSGKMEADAHSAAMRLQ
jgi:hypothetical protein